MATHDGNDHTGTCIQVRFATAEDTELVYAFIHALAAYTGDEATVTSAMIHEHFFGPNPRIEALIAEYNGRPEGFATFFETFSTYQGRPSLWLEDFFVNPDARGVGIGHALFQRLTELVCERSYCRLDFSVLNWNTPAAEFYARLRALPVFEYTIYRLTEEAASSNIAVQPYA